MLENHPTESLPAYSLGCLERDDAEQVKTHLLHCVTCQSELKVFEEVSALLGYTASQIVPRKTLKKKLLALVGSRKSYLWFETLFDRWPRLVPAISLAAIVLVVVLGSTSAMFWLQKSDTKQLEKLAGKPLVFMQGTESMPTAAGRLIAERMASTGLLLVTALRPLGESLQYQLWLIRDGQRTSGAVFSVDEHGMAAILVSSTQPLGSYDGFGITIEPYGGSPGPTGKKVLGVKNI